MSYPRDRRVVLEAEALVASGAKVTVISPDGPGTRATDERLDGVRVLRYRAPPGGVGAAGYLREYAVSLWRISRLLRRVREEGTVEVVFSCNPPDLLIFLGWGAARRGAGLVFDHHDLAPELFARKFGRRGVVWRALLALERAAYRTADVVLQPNDSYAQIASERGGVRRDRLFVVRHGVDPERIFPVAPRPELRRGRRWLVLWVGQITQRERVEALLDAAQEIGRRRDDVAFSLVGPGEAREAVLADVRRRGLDARVELPGPVYGEDLRAYLSTADVCVSVDLSNPMNDASTVTKVIDYMTMGRPVVQFPLPEMAGVCGDSTLYAAEGDPVALADAIESLLDDREQAERLGAAAQRRVLEHFDWQRQVPILLAAVDQAARAGLTRRRLSR